MQKDSTVPLPSLQEQDGGNSAGQVRTFQGCLALLAHLWQVAEEVSSCCTVGVCICSRRNTFRVGFLTSKDVALLVCSYGLVLSRTEGRSQTVELP